MEKINRFINSKDESLLVFNPKRSRLVIFSDIEPTKSNSIKSTIYDLRPLEYATSGNFTTVDEINIFTDLLSSTQLSINGGDPISSYKQDPIFKCLMLEYNDILAITEGGFIKFLPSDTQDQRLSLMKQVNCLDLRYQLAKRNDEDFKVTAMEISPHYKHIAIAILDKRTGIPELILVKLNSGRLKKKYGSRFQVLDTFSFSEKFHQSTGLSS